MPRPARQCGPVSLPSRVIWSGCGAPAEHGVSSALGLWRAADAAQMQAIVEALPLYPYVRDGNHAADAAPK